ncbi:hypothetical protein LINPERHAP2_LOCUS6628 [Linum perenne]
MMVEIQMFLTRMKSMVISSSMQRVV